MFISKNLSELLDSFIFALSQCPRNDTDTPDGKTQKKGLNNQNKPLFLKLRILERGINCD